MASATENDEKSMAIDVAAGGEEERPRPSAPSSADKEGGFFHIYKPGQGYWTRMGTAGAALLIAALCVNFMYREFPAWIRPLFDKSAQFTDAVAKNAAAQSATLTSGHVTLGICAAFLAGFSLLVFWLMNKPSNADFLIATDSEMKKVNWTSKKELWGSTKIVINFMFLIATMLFSFDIIFGYLFYFIGVLKTPPF